MTKNLHSDHIYSSSASQASAMFCVPKLTKPEITHFITDF